MNAYHSKEDLKLRVDEARKHTSDCVSTSELWICFTSGQGHYSKAWNSFGPTLSILHASLFEGLVLSLYKLLEPEGKAPEYERVNLWRILALAGQLQVLDPPIRTALKQKLHSVESTWSKVEMLRHNLVAHGKVELSVEDELRRSGLISSEWKRMYTVYAEVLNAIAEKLGVEKLDVKARRVHFAANAKRFFEVLDS
ncbi:MAG TPA: hypothetical protein VNL17_15665 [Verrucomicrobiae bacterium]|nr:hypothetical protein [Verrucomicrobiae bacterium]